MNLEFIRTVGVGLSGLVASITIEQINAYLSAAVALATLVYIIQKIVTKDDKSDK